MALYKLGMLQCNVVIGKVKGKLTPWSIMVMVNCYNVYTHANAAEEDTATFVQHR